MVPQDLARSRAGDPSKVMLDFPGQVNFLKKIKKTLNPCLAYQVMEMNFIPKTFIRSYFTNFNKADIFTEPT